MPLLIHTNNKKAGAVPHVFMLVSCFFMLPVGETECKV